MYPRKVFFLISTVLLMSGCAANNYWNGVWHLEQKDYDSALLYLQLAEHDQPHSFKVKRELGYAYFLSGQLDRAIKTLTEAQRMNEKDGKVILHLGLCHELMGDYAHAIDQYRRYTKVSRLSHFRAAISARIRYLTIAKVEKEVEQAIAREDSISVAEIPPNAVAVLYFRNLTDNEDMDVMMKGLAELLAIDLSKVKRLRIVERMKLQKLLEELELSQSDAVDATTAPRMGKLLGAARQITGAFVGLDPVQIRIDATISELSSPEPRSVPEVTGNMDDLLTLEKELVFQIIEEMGIELSWDERREIGKMPTASLLAFMAYARGLDLEDRGQFGRAVQQYEKAVQIDPGFDLAESRLRLGRSTSRIEAEGERLPSPDQLARSYAASGGDGLGEWDRFSRLVRASETAQQGQMVSGDRDTREPDSEGTGADRPFSTDQPARIGIVIYLPD